MKTIVRTIEAGRCLPLSIVKDRIKALKLEMLETSGSYLISQGILGYLNLKGERVEEGVYILESVAPNPAPDAPECKVR